MRTVPALTNSKMHVQISIRDVRYRWSELALNRAPDTELQSHTPSERVSELRTKSRTLHSRTKQRFASDGNYL